jgi:hypothetical protein
MVPLNGDSRPIGPDGGVVYLNSVTLVVTDTFGPIYRGYLVAVKG